jgi:hypothetical protein
MQLTEVLFMTESRDRADALAAHLGEVGYDVRVMPGDGSKTVWQVRAIEQPLREFDDEIEFHRFLDDTLQPLAEAFDARVAGGSLSYGGGALHTFNMGFLNLGATSRTTVLGWASVLSPDLSGITATQ